MSSRSFSHTVVILLFSLFFPHLLAAQVEMSVNGGLVLKPNDTDASAYFKETDANDKVCAIVKVTTTNPVNAPLVLDTGAGTATVKMQKQATGEWWYWLSPDTKNISFAAAGYKRTAPLGVSLQPGKVYTLNLTVGAALKVVQEVTLQEAIIKLFITPKQCVVSYGPDTSCSMGQKMLTDGYFEAFLNKGTYYYKIENEYYETLTGTFVLREDAQEETLSMRPAFGYLSISSEPSGADVYLDGSFSSIGKTPLTTPMLKKGPHRIVLNKESYYNYETTFEVARTSTTQTMPEIKLKPAYGIIRVTSDPIGADVYLDGSLESSGKTPFESKALPQGEHKIRIVKENYYINDISFNLAATGAAQDVPIVVLAPQFGSVTCLCPDEEAELTVSDPVGRVIKSGKSGMQVTLNSRNGYKLKASRPSHAPQETIIPGGKELEGKSLTISVEAPVPLYGILQLSSEPSQASIYIDGKYVSKTGWIGKVLIGEHKIELLMDGYNKAAFVVKIEENQKTIESRKLEKGVRLSEHGTANCYIVSKPGHYSFPTVKGNSNQPVGNVSSAEVLWESFGTDIAPNKGDIISNVFYSQESGTINFVTPSTLQNGNAVIAAKDASGTILWSWHIWVCEGYDPVATTQEYYNNAGTMMDRNLGATSATPGDVGALGLLYQWGRKDPFLGSSSILFNKRAASTITWPSAESSSVRTGTIKFAVKNPTTFITAGSSSNSDWVHSNRDNTLWQSSKTKYDPCPPGWRVPDGGKDGVWSKAVGSDDRFAHTYDSTHEGMDFHHKFGSASMIWYPATGWLDNENGGLNQVGSNGLLWSCTPRIYDSTIYRLYFRNKGDVGPSVTDYKAFGFSVRCQKEEAVSINMVGEKPSSNSSSPLSVFTMVYAHSDDGFVNVRSKPSASGDILAELHEGFHGIGDGILLEKGEFWSKVDVGGVTGWCNNRYLGYQTWYEGNGGNVLVSKKDDTPIYLEDSSKYEHYPVIARIPKNMILADKYVRYCDYYVLETAGDPILVLDSDVSEKAPEDVFGGTSASATRSSNMYPTGGKVSELMLQPNDMDARAYYRYSDQNDKVCAIVKVTTTNPVNAPLVLDTGAGAATVKMEKQATGEWWYWLSPDTKNISFAADGYKRTEPMDISLQPGQVYRLHLTLAPLP